MSKHLTPAKAKNVRTPRVYFPEEFGSAGLYSAMDPQQLKILGALTTWNAPGNTKGMFPKHAAVAAFAGCEKRTVDYHLAALVHAGLLLSQPGKRADGKRSTTTYRFADLANPALIAHLLRVLHDPQFPRLARLANRSKKQFEPYLGLWDSFKWKGEAVPAVEAAPVIVPPVVKAEEEPDPEPAPETADPGMRDFLLECGIAAGFVPGLLKECARYGYTVPQLRPHFAKLVVQPKLNNPAAVFAKCLREGAYVEAGRAADPEDAEYCRVLLRQLLGRFMDEASGDSPALWNRVVEQLVPTLTPYSRGVKRPACQYVDNDGSVRVTHTSNWPLDRLLSHLCGCGENVKEWRFLHHDMTLAQIAEPLLAGLSRIECLLVQAVEEACEATEDLYGHIFPTDYTVNQADIDGVLAERADASLEAA